MLAKKTQLKGLPHGLLFKISKRAKTPITEEHLVGKTDLQTERCKECVLVRGWNRVAKPFPSVLVIYRGRLALDNWERPI